MHLSPRPLLRLLSVLSDNSIVVGLLFNVLLIMGVLCSSLILCAFLCSLPSFLIILTRKRELVALLLLSYGYLVSVNVQWLFLMM